MCGIAGYLGFHGERLLEDMSRRIAHRGPDGSGEWHDGEAMVGLAHRRLSIIDTSPAAAQPMLGCNSRYVVVFNGEIYNFRELGKELRANGYHFNPNSDTAIIAPLYDLKGEAMLQCLEGMFCFALWDRERRELFIARDAFGVKPLYYANISQGLIFASELKALIACRTLDRAIDVGAIRDYLIHLWSPGQRTPLRSVSKLPPGHSIRARGGALHVTEWRLRPAPIFDSGRVDRRACIQELGALFDRVVADHCVSDVPVGAFLSGGVDSSAIVAAMIGSGNAPRRAYCIGFAGRGLVDEGFSDDLGYAREVAHQLGVPLTALMVDPPTLSDMEALVYTLDEPEADPAPLYVGAIAEAAQADGVKVLLSGAGGDDIFTGYRRHRAAALRARIGVGARLMLGCIPQSVARFIGPIERRRLDKLRYMFAGSDDDFLIRAFEFNPLENVSFCLGADVRRELDAPPSEWLRRALEGTTHWPLVERMLDLELHGFLPDHNLNYTDRASMAHGVEVRVPFLDSRLFSHARRIPWRMKVRFLSEKWALKQAVSGPLPAAVLKRRKTGFGAPIRSWLVNPMNEMVEDLLASRAFRERGLFDSAAVRATYDDVRAGRGDNAYLVLGIMMTELWMRRFIDEARSGTICDKSAAV